MDQRQVRRVRRAQFSQMLVAYRQRHKLTLAQLAVLLQTPEGTVKNWVRGSRIPPLGRVKEVCAKLNIDPAVAMSDGAVRGLFYETQVLGFEALQSRYLEVHTEDPMSAYDYVTVAGALLFNHLLRAGLECSLQAKHDLSTWINFVTTPLQNKILNVRPNGKEGIGFILFFIDGQIKLPWTRLTTTSATSLADSLISDT